MSEPLYCDCHAAGDGGKAKLAERDGRRIIIRDRQKDDRHLLVIDIEHEYNRWKERQQLERARSDGG